MTTKDANNARVYVRGTIRRRIEHLNDMIRIATNAGLSGATFAIELAAWLEIDEMLAETAPRV